MTIDGKERAGLVFNTDDDVCRLTLRLVSTDAGLVRLVSLLARKRWSILELHYRRADGVVELAASRADGRMDQLIAVLQREVGVVSVEPARRATNVAGRPCGSSPSRSVGSR